MEIHVAPSRFLRSFLLNSLSAYRNYWDGHFRLRHVCYLNQGYEYVCVFRQSSASV